MSEVVVTISEREFKLVKWNMLKQLENQKHILPLISAPITNALVAAPTKDGDGEISEEEQAVYMAAILKGVMDALQGCDILVVARVLLEGVTFTNSKGIPKMADFKELEADGLDVSDLYAIMCAVIKLNYSPFIKGGLQKLMTQLL